jgi:hypothetical protein
MFYLANYSDAFGVVSDALIFAVNKFVPLFPEFEEGFPVEVHHEQCSPG